LNPAGSNNVAEPQMFSAQAGYFWATFVQTPLSYNETTPL
jgi:hypothetical protein